MKNIRMIGDANARKSAPELLSERKKKENPTFFEINTVKNL